MGILGGIGCGLVTGFGGISSGILGGLFGSLGGLVGMGAIGLIIVLLVMYELKKHAIGLLFLAGIFFYLRYVACA